MVHIPVREKNRPIVKMGMMSCGIKISAATNPAIHGSRTQSNGARNGAAGSVSEILITTLATIASPCLDVFRNGGSRRRLAFGRA